MLKLRHIAFLILLSGAWGLKAQDTIPPVITLNPAATGCINLTCGNTPYVDPGCKAIDNVDGDISSLVKVTGYVNTRRVGEYKLTYTVTDQAGNSDTVYRNICVANTIGPQWPSYKFEPYVLRNHNDYFISTYQLPITRYHYDWIIDGDTVEELENVMAFSKKFFDHNEHEVCISENYCNADTNVVYCTKFSDTMQQSYWLLGNSFRDFDQDCYMNNNDETGPLMYGFLFDNFGKEVSYIGDLLFESGSGFALLDSGKAYTMRFSSYGPDTLNFSCLNHGLTIGPLSYKDSSLNFNFAFNCKPYTSDFFISNLGKWDRCIPGSKTRLCSYFYNKNTNSLSNCNSPDTGRLVYTLKGPAKFIACDTSLFTLDSMSDQRLSLKEKHLSKQSFYHPPFATILVDTNAQITDSVTLTGSIETAISESDKTNNVLSTTFKLNSSYDPNMKTVDKAIVSPGFDGELNYLIQFQNTGTSEAINITVADTLSPLLDTSAFVFLSSSHEMTMTRTGRYLKFEFKNIYLPDSGSNEMASHGYLTFKAKPIQAMQNETSIDNTAYIYFDFNPAVITNTCTTTALDKNSSVSRLTTQDFKIYPNPAEDRLYIQHAGQGSAAYTITDITGRTLLEAPLQTGNNSINISMLKPGLYIVRISTSTGVRDFRILKL